MLSTKLGLVKSEIALSSVARDLGQARVGGEDVERGDLWRVEWLIGSAWTRVVLTLLQA